jgi:hypothetical protein
MQMDSGIGRAGYRLLAFMFFGVGLLGLAVAWLAVPTPVDRFVMIGTGLAAIGLVALTGFTFLLTLGAGGPRQRKAPKQRAEAAVEAPGDMDFEYPAGSPTTLRPLAQRAETHAAPVAMTPVAAPSPPTRTPMAEMRDRYTQEAPMVREILAGTGQQVVHEKIPEVTAKRVPPGAKPGQSPPGTTMGRCGSCNTIIYAPTARPLRLRCPSCSKVTLLK